MTDTELSCYKCKTHNSTTNNNNIMKCNTCKSWIHLKCNKFSKKQADFFLNNPEEFDCRSCLTCKICNKLVALNHRGILRSLCQHWTHVKCNKLDQTDFTNYVNDKSQHYFCSPCLKEALPVMSLNDNEFRLTMNGINYSDDKVDVDNVCLTDKQIELTNKINEALAKGIDFDDDDSSPNIDMIDCKYYTIDSFNNQKFNDDSSFSIFHLNIHSVEYHIEELRVVLQLLNVPFDIICLTESKIRVERQLKVDININGYQTPVGVPTEASKGGVLVYVKNGLTFCQRDDLNMYKPKELESTFIEILDSRGKNTIVGSIYRHPCMDQNLFIDDFLKPLCEKLQGENKKYYLAGDYNFDLSNLKHEALQTFFETMMSNFLQPAITLPTKINSLRHTVIDNIFTNQIGPGLRSGNVSVAISDHLPSFLFVPHQNRYHIPKQNLYRRDSKNFDRNNFVLDFLDIDWDRVLQLDKNDVNISLSIFLSKMNHLLDKYLPWKKVSTKEFKRQTKPWITDEIFKKIKLKSRVFKRYISCKDTQLNMKNRLLEEFKALKNEITALTRLKKKDYYNRYFNNNKRNLQKTWKGIKEIIDIKSKNLDFPSFIKHRNEIITDEKSIAKSFNDYFVSVADEILKSRKYEGKNSHKNYLVNPLPNTFVVRECDQQEVENLIMSLNGKKASGLNSIPVDILKLLKSDISIPLFKIYNLSLLNGTFPDKLKIAKTIPIYKKGNRHQTSNYRPISLLSNLNKILEKIMFKRTYDFLVRYKCLYKLQFGFRKKFSTKHALIKITEAVRMALDENKAACGIFIDLQKAFDTVNHSILVDKLNHYGIRGIASNWFKSYLKNRMQFVSINGFDSEAAFVAHGVPQGSVLGPLLFLIYINDLHKSIRFSSVYHFADDTNLLNISDSLKRCQKQINLDLKALYKWLLANKISLNCSKTELIIFKKAGSLQKYNLRIKLNGHRIFPSDSIKYLGIKLDSTLSGSAHFSFLSSKLRRANGLLSKIRHYVPLEQLKSIYYAIFSSHLSYGSQVWGQKLLDTHLIRKLQNRAIRIINFKPSNYNTNNLYKTSNILKINDMVKVENILFIYDYLNNLLPDCFQNEFHLLANSYTSVGTRRSNLGCLHIGRRKSTKYGTNSISHQSIQNWNSTTKLFKCNLALIARNKLKSKLRHHFLDIN